MNKGISTCIITFAVALLCCSRAYCADPWSLPQGDSVVFSSFVHENFDEFFRGKEESDLPFGELNQFTVSTGFNYGVTDDITLDVVFGYTATDGGLQGEDEGLNDTTLGIRYKIVDEFNVENPVWTPTLSIATRFIIPGTYDEGQFPVSPGDGAFGGEFSLIYGKFLGETGFGLYGDVGYRLREEPVPDDFFTSLGVLQQLGWGLTSTLEFRHVAAVNGIDLGTEEFMPGRAMELRERSEQLEFGLGWTHEASGIVVGGLFGITLDGRNSGDKRIWVAYASLPLG